MEFNLKYGRGVMPFMVPDGRILEVVEPRELPGLADPLAEVRRHLRAPIGSPPLARLVAEKWPAKVAIIVNDLTRPTPFPTILPPILAELHGAGLAREQIRFFIATGAHEPQAAEQNRQIFGPELVEHYSFITHDADGELADLGLLPSGNPLYLNKEVCEADFVIATGAITFHWFAGFSGGRKSVLPGIAGRVTIERNHREMVRLLAKEPPIDENPVSLEMIEAARRLGVDFIVNVVTNSRKEIVRIVAGDLVEAWRSGVETCAAMYSRGLARTADLTIASAGGYPNDINMYQAQKALENAGRATRDGGVIILLAECRDGLGDRVFAQWMREAAAPAEIETRIRKEFVLGGHKAYGLARVVAKKEVILLSSLDREATETLFCRKAGSPAQALALAEGMLGRDYAAVVIPEAGLVRPSIKEPRGNVMYATKGKGRTCRPGPCHRSNSPE